MPVQLSQEVGLGFRELRAEFGGLPCGVRDERRDPIRFSGITSALSVCLECGFDRVVSHSLLRRPAKFGGLPCGVRAGRRD